MQVTWYVEVLSFFAGLLCTISFLPQVIKTFKERNPKGISLSTFSMLGGGVTLWFSVGFCLGSPSMMFWNGIQVILILSVVFMKIRFSRRAHREKGEWSGSHIP